MSPIELLSRREALGLSQTGLAVYANVTQAAVSNWELGKRGMPDDLDGMLVEIEDFFALLVEEVSDAVEHASALHDRPDIDFLTFGRDEDFWAADARARDLGAPASLHRAATAHAAWMARYEFDIQVRIVAKEVGKVPANPSQPGAARPRPISGALSALPVIATAAERDALEPGTVVRSAAGTIACRHTTGGGVVFGDERPFDWSDLALPLTVLWPQDDGSSR